MAELRGSDIVDYFAQIAPYVNEIIPGDIGVTIAKAAGRSTEQVLSDALYRLAGELSLEALQKARPHSES